MWDRVVLKERGKEAIRRNYWKCVLVSLILMLFVQGSAGSSARGTSHSSDQNNTEDYSYTVSAGTNAFNFNFDLGDGASILFRNPVIGFFTGMFLLIVVILTIILRIFVFAPMEIGGCRFFIENAYAPSEPGRLLFSFHSGHYSKMVLTMFCRDFFVSLWSLLFVIPGIIKSYEYRMVPYLMADAPDLTRQEAFRISKDLMYGQKMNAFVLDLSFIGWQILSVCTCGLLGVFYVNSYINATNAELFLELKRQYFSAQN